jgi:hypothetical protein
LVAGQSTTKVPTYFHVITGNGGAGGLSDAVIQSQITALNAGFRPVGFEFELAQINRVSNDAWFNFAYSDEAKMKPATVQGTAATLNVWTVNLAINQGTLGFASELRARRRRAPTQAPALGGARREPAPWYRTGGRAAYLASHYGQICRSGNFSKEYPFTAFAEVVAGLPGRRKNLHRHLAHDRDSFPPCSPHPRARPCTALPGRYKKKPKLDGVVIDYRTLPGVENGWP